LGDDGKRRTAANRVKTGPHGDVHSSAAAAAAHGTVDAYDRLGAALRGANVALWERNLETGAMVLSPEWKRQLGYDADELDECYETWVSRLHLDDRATTLDHVARCMDGRTKTYRAEFRLRHRDVSYRWIMAQGEAIPAADGKASRMVGCHIDITARKAAEIALDELARVAVENPNPVLRIDRDGILRYANPAAQGILAEWGCAMGQPVPADWAGRARASLTTAPRAEERLSARGRLFLVTFAPQPERGHANLYCRDVTEATLLEVQLRQSQKLESIGTLAGGIAHEINNPINGIMNYAELIRDRLENADAATVEYAAEIIHETERVAAIVRNLLAFARQGSQTAKPEQLALLVDDTLSLVRTVMRRDNVTVDVDIEADLPDVVCIGQQIQQVVMNLLTNARDALKGCPREPGVDRRVQLRIRRLADDAQWVRLTVADEGCGISPEIRERIFDPFFSTKPRHAGTGLGLSISHGIVHQHGGRISVDSEPNAGARFHVDLPIARGR